MCIHSIENLCKTAITNLSYRRAYLNGMHIIGVLVRCMHAGFLDSVALKLMLHCKACDSEMCIAVIANGKLLM